ncbi:hypothetical protein BDB00DRAFT_853066, partial [Zychaea mexicana]|uniref:uncharacterized protein n=1 Tax=Zychaea mexicana TaxID=64656 RepID=UPI0022FEBCA2
MLIGLSRCLCCHGHTAVAGQFPVARLYDGLCKLVAGLLFYMSRDDIMEAPLVPL